MDWLTQDRYGPSGPYVRERKRWWPHAPEWVLAERQRILCGEDPCPDVGDVEKVLELDRPAGACDRSTAGLDTP